MGTIEIIALAFFGFTAIIFALAIKRYRDRVWAENELANFRKRHAWSPWQWTQDGWVRTCKFCKVPDFGGDAGAPNL